MRERRPDAAGGTLIKQLASRLDRVMEEYGAKPYEELLQLIRTARPLLPFQLKQVDEAANTVEFYYSHRGRAPCPAGLVAARAGPGLPGRPVVTPGAHRPPDGPRHPTGLVLHPPERPDDGLPTGGTPVVTATGGAVELLLFAYGRQSAAKVELEGEKEAIARLHETKQLGI